MTLVEQLSRCGLGTLADALSASLGVRVTFIITGELLEVRPHSTDGQCDDVIALTTVEYIHMFLFQHVLKRAQGINICIFKRITLFLDSY